MQLDAIRALVQTELDAINQLLSHCLQSPIALINQLTQHIIQSGGKRIRPLLVLLCARAFSYQGKTHVELAAIIELIHTATLLHDDVIDASNLRRGKQTANAIWGNTASVLVGDYLYSRAFQMMVNLRNLEIIELLAQATNTIVEGEVLQLTNCGDPETTESRYLEVIHFKTGTLFEVAAKLGAVLNQCSPHQITSMATYGLNLGIAFQLIDDALDYCGTPDEIGKNSGDDLAEGKPTLPLIHALCHGTTQQQQNIRQAIETRSNENIDSIIQTIESTQAIAYTYQLAKQYIVEAIKQLDHIPESPYREALFNLAKFAIERRH